MSIPQIIHYCWFGGKPKPPLAQKCIESWKRFCPDYTLMEWNESNFDLTQVPQYVKDACREKRWAFVTDYVRLCALVEHGGIYMDTDVEVIRPLDAYLLHTAFAGFESTQGVQTGLLACEPGFPLFAEFLRHYDTASLYREDGSVDTTTNVDVLTNLCRKRGLEMNDTLQTVEGLTVYPKAYFCPVDFDTKVLRKTRKTAVIHWFSGSWHTEAELEQMEREKLQKKAEARSNLRVAIGTRLFGEKGYQKLKAFLKGE